MASAGAKAIMKAPRPAVMRRMLHQRFGRVITLSCLTAWIPGLIYWNTHHKARVDMYKNFYSNYDPEKDAWDMVYDAFPGGKHDRVASKCFLHSASNLRAFSFFLRSSQFFPVKFGCLWKGAVCTSESSPHSGLKITVL